MNIRFVYMTMIVVCLSSQAFAQATPFTDLQSRVRKGTLKNGLTYYIVKNDTPANSIEFQLLDKAGFFSEERDERGISHLVEHMGFRSTRHFPGGLKDYFINKGLAFGGDINASTNKNTVYELTIPSNDSTLFKAAFWALRDWADGLSFLPKEIAEEQGAVINEAAKAKDSVSQSKAMAEYKLLDRHPLYARTTDSVDFKNVTGATAQSLRTFYETWYSPDRQAIVIVGDIDPVAVEKKIIAEFSSLRRNGLKVPSIEGMRKKYDVPLTGENKLVIANHGSRNPLITVRIYKKQKNQMLGGPARCRERAMDQIYNELLKDRIDRLRLDEEKIRIVSEVQRFAMHNLAGIDALRTYIFIRDHDDVKTGIELISRELYRIERWGFSGEEFASAKNRAIENLRSQTRRPLSSSIVGRFANNFIDPIEVPLWETCSNDVESVSVADINRFSANWNGFNENVDILLDLPDATSAKRFSKTKVFSWINDVQKSDVAPMVKKSEVTLAEPSIDTTRIRYKTQRNTDTGIVQLNLNNGVRVFLKRLGSLKDAPDKWNEVALTGFANSCSKNSDQNRSLTGRTSAQVVSMSGFKTLSKNDLLDWTSDKNKNGYLDIQPYIQENEVGLRGGGSTLNNFNDLLKLAYYYRFEPQTDRSAFETWKSDRHREEEEKKTAMNVFWDSIQSTINGRASITHDKTDAVKFDNLLKIYKDRFANAQDMTFVVAGYFEEQDVIPALTKYLGALPKAQKNSSCIDIPYKQSKVPLQPVARRISMKRDSTGNANVRILLPVHIQDNPEAQVKMQVVKEIINWAMFTRLREKEKGVYDVVARQYGNKNGQYFIDVDFETMPVYVERMVAATIDEVTHSLKDSLREQDFNNAWMVVKKKMASGTLYPRVCIDELKTQIRNGSMDPDPLLKLKLLKKVTSATVRETFRAGFNPKDYLVFTLY